MWSQLEQSNVRSSNPVGPGEMRASFARKLHARSASRAAKLLNCEQWDCGWVIGHCIPLGSDGSAKLSVTGRYRRGRWWDQYGWCRHKNAPDAVAPFEGLPDAKTAQCFRMFAAFEAGGPLGRWRRRSTRLAGLNCRWNATADAGFVVRPNRSQPRDPSAAIVGPPARRVSWTPTRANSSIAAQGWPQLARGIRRTQSHDYAWYTCHSRCSSEFIKDFEIGFFERGAGCFAEVRPSSESPQMHGQEKCQH